MVIGGDAAGMSAASQARRLKGPDELEIVAFERGHFSSYSACGIPYWVGGDVPERDDLIARTPAEHRERAIDLRMRTEVTEIDVAGRAGALPRPGDGHRDVDRLRQAGHRDRRATRPPAAARHRRARCARGADPRRRPGPAGHPGPRTRAAARSSSAPATSASRWPRRCWRGFEVTVLNRGEQPMATLDPDMGRLVHRSMDGMGITTVAGAEVTKILTGEDGRVRAVATEDAEYPADVVVLGIGVEPETALARAAGLPLGEYGGLLTDLAMRVRGHENIWAGGDCVEVLDLVSGRERHVPLGTHANKHGQVIGSNVGGGYATFPGVVGTAVSKVCDLEIARTGLREKDARAVGLRYVTATIESTNTRRLLPGRRADDGEDARGTPHGPAARRPDRRRATAPRSASTSRRWPSRRA